ncbi:MAG: hypothetical protein IKG42_03655 [Clostridia bacterium]|nr:hypothetical protein [Clostridia bacterium]
MKNKLLYIIMLIAIVLGVIVICIKGFNLSVDFSKHQRILVNIDTEFDIKDMKKIAKESFKSDYKVRKSNLFGTAVIFDVKDVSDEEIRNLLDKINEKYGTEYNIKQVKLPQIIEEMNLSDISSMTDDEINEKITTIIEEYDLEYTADELKETSSKVRLINVEKIKLYDYLKPYILPSIISFVLVLVYFGIRYCKLEKNAWFKEPFKLLIKTVLIQLFLISAIAITRIPVNEYLAVALISILMLQIIVETVKNENRAIAKKGKKD